MSHYRAPLRAHAENMFLLKVSPVNRELSFLLPRYFPIIRIDDRKMSHAQEIELAHHLGT